MSDKQVLGRMAAHELAITAEKAAAYRARMIDQAVQLAREGQADAAYRKLLMVVAIDGVRAEILGVIDDARIDKADEPASN